MADFFATREVVEMAVQVEKSGALYYETVAGQTAVRDVRDLFLMLAGEERKHAETFLGLYRQVSAGPERSPADWDEVSRYLKSLTDSRFFLGGDTALTLARQAATANAAIETALAFEKETLLFYYGLADALEPETRRVVRALIEAEQGHIRKLTDLKHHITERS